MAKNMAFATVGNIIVALHNGSPPGEDEWGQYCRAITAMEFDKVRPIAFSDGGGPDSKQRKLLNEVIAGRPGRSALVTNSTIARSVVTALSWFNPLIKAFSPEEASRAFEYLQLDPGEVQAVRLAIRTLSMKFSPALKSVIL